MIQVILINDVENLGIKGEIVRVKPGFARNFLIPQRLAKPATTGNLKALEKERRTFSKKALLEKKKAEQFKQILEDLELRFDVKAGPEGKLFGSVTSADIAEMMAAKTKSEIERKRLMLSNPLKQVGKYEVVYKLHPEVAASIKITVVAEQVKVEKPEPALAETAQAEESKPVEAVEAVEAVEETKTTEASTAVETA